VEVIFEEWVLKVSVEGGWCRAEEVVSAADVTGDFAAVTPAFHFRTCPLMAIS